MKCRAFQTGSCKSKEHPLAISPKHAVWSGTGLTEFIISRSRDSCLRCSHHRRAAEYLYNASYATHWWQFTLYAWETNELPHYTKTIYCKPDPDLDDMDTEVQKLYLTMAKLIEEAFSYFILNEKIMESEAKGANSLHSSH